MRYCLGILLGATLLVGCDPIEEDETPPEQRAARNVLGEWIVNGTGTFSECENPQYNEGNFTFSADNTSWIVTRRSSGTTSDADELLRTMETEAVGGQGASGGSATPGEDPTTAENLVNLSIQIPLSETAQATGYVLGSTVRFAYSETTQEGLLAFVFSGVIDEAANISGTFIHHSSSICKASGDFTVTVNLAPDSRDPMSGGVSGDFGGSSGAAVDGIPSNLGGMEGPTAGSSAAGGNEANDSTAGASSTGGAKASGLPSADVSQSGGNPSASSAGAQSP